MFNGLIKETGAIKRISKQSGNYLITIKANNITNDLYIGSSIAINGICQTVTFIEHNSFQVEAIKETLDLTSLKYSKVKDKVNLELPVKIGDDISGHLIAGHIDGTGKIRDISNNQGSKIFSIVIPNDLTKYIAHKGSIAVDGISLTVAEINNNIFKVAIIPHTFKNTTLADITVNGIVNIETDMIAKYISNNIKEKNKSNITTEILSQNGFI